LHIFEDVGKTEWTSFARPPSEQSMKITAVEPIHIAIPYEHGAPKTVLGGTTAVRTTQDAVYLRVETDAGLTGWGEAFGFAACAITHAAVKLVVAPLCIGRDPTDIPALMDDLHKSLKNMARNGPVAFALSGLDIALWDIAGKMAGQPIHALIGGARKTHVPAYASLLRLNTPDNVTRVAHGALARGYKHIKLHERTVEAVAAARAAIGPDVSLMLDTNCQWSVDQALTMAREMAPYELSWLEEPIYPPDDFTGLALLRRESGLRIAAGENLGNIMDVAHIMATQAVDIVQPDVAKMGGITEIIKAVALARAAQVEAEPHSPLYGPALMATLHVIAVMPEDVMCEFYYADLEANPIGALATPRDGRFAVPTGPGLGITVDEALLTRYRVE
jgi:L-alanine-DL-glutamate epimerase-like enolase superfamily enzyme